MGETLALKGSMLWSSKARSDGCRPEDIKSTVRNRSEAILSKNGRGDVRNEEERSRWLVYCCTGVDVGA